MGAGSPQTIGVTLCIRGRVQGVGYRAWAVHTGRKLGLTGWVRNLTDGSVEAFAIGSEEAVGSFTAACQAGPPTARVTDVRTISREVNPPPLGGFQQVPTAGGS